MTKGFLNIDGSLHKRSEYPELFKSLKSDNNNYTPYSFKSTLKPNTSVFKHFIVFKKKSSYPIGYIILSYSTPNFALQCNGAVVKISKFLDLYLIIGDMFSVEEIKLNTFKNKVLDTFPFLIKYFKYDIEKKRKCEEYQFCLPDYRTYDFNQ